MSSDNLRLRPTPAFTTGGPGTLWTRRCDKCGRPIPNLGRRQVKLRSGVKLIVGQCCFKLKPPKP